MASKQTWDRRLLAGLIDVLDEQGLSLVTGLDIAEDGAPTEFFYEVLSEAEVERLQGRLDALRDRFQTRLDRLGGVEPASASEESLEEDEGPEDDGAGEDVDETIEPAPAIVVDLYELDERGEDESSIPQWEQDSPHQG